LSSYFVKGRRGKTALWESVRSSAMPRSVIHVSTKLTMQTGCTMRALRLKRALFVLWGVSVSQDELRAIASVLAARPETSQSERPGRDPPAPEGQQPRDRDDASSARRVFRTEL